LTLLAGRDNRPFAPLDGIRVVDLTPSLPGTHVHADPRPLGADGVKVEHPQRGDEARASGPPFVDGGSVMFFAANASKRSLGPDVKTGEGREALLRLLDRADVFVQSMRPGTVDRLGLGATIFLALFRSERFDRNGVGQDRCPQLLRVIRRMRGRAAHDGMARGAGLPFRTRRASTRVGRR
jgi:hypothetical protein